MCTGCVLFLQRKQLHSLLLLTKTSSITDCLYDGKQSLFFLKGVVGVQKYCQLCLDASPILRAPSHTILEEKVMTACSLVILLNSNLHLASPSSVEG